MAIEVKIPAVGESITSGVVSVWHKKSGDYVNAGEALFTLETDKVSTEITAEKAGVLETRVKEGAEVKIGEVVATIDDSKSAPPGGREKAGFAGKRGDQRRPRPRRKKKRPARFLLPCGESSTNNIWSRRKLPEPERADV